MNQKITLLAGLSLAFLAGCGNTAEGVKKDAEVNGEKSAQKTQAMADGMSETGKNISAATMLTPKIKLAITGDKSLNDAANMINVDSTAEKVVLDGHVVTQAMKDLAGDLADKVMKENNAVQKLENNLVVKP